MKTIRLTLPPPVSANDYWAYADGVHVTRKAKDYKEHVGWLARSAGVECLTGPVRVTLDVYRKQKRGDLDNSLKVLLDAMNGICYTDDRQIVEIVARRHDDPANARVEVEITEADDE